MFLGSGRNHWRALLIVPLVLCIPAWAQQTEKDRAGRDESAPYRTAEPSDLTKDNLNRVAASAAQIQGVLLKDAGLLVELKRWVSALRLPDPHRESGLGLRQRTRVRSEGACAAFGADRGARGCRGPAQ